MRLKKWRCLHIKTVLALINRLFRRNSMNYGTGRIGEVIAYLKKKHGADIKQISASDKLHALCESLQMNRNTFDRMISENSPVFRTVKGHAFESFFDSLLEANGIKVTEVGGDDAVDRIVNSKSLQLKTCTEAGTKGTIVQYKTHKTHGAKSEQESMDYYHRVDHFAEYLIGLVSYDPLNVVVIEKRELPRHPLSKDHILSPFSIDWSTHPSLNAFSRIGVTLKNVGATKPVPGQEVLPLTSKKLGISSDVILNTILNDANFRIWDMSIRGFSREVIFQEMVAAHGIKMYKPSDLRSNRADKADHAVKISGSSRFIQMKGISTNNCELNKKDPVIATETQLTRGRVNDHPTQSRLYLRSDFDYLVLGMDPPVVDMCRKSSGTGAGLEWEFYLIPTQNLEGHHEMPHRLKSLQKFSYSSLQKYKITDWKKSLS